MITKTEKHKMPVGHMHPKLTKRYSQARHFEPFEVYRSKVLGTKCMKEANFGLVLQKEANFDVFDLHFLTTHKTTISTRGLISTPVTKLNPFLKFFFQNWLTPSQARIFLTFFGFFVRISFHA